MDDRPKRTLLYYPGPAPSVGWLRQALLYWDKVTSLSYFGWIPEHLKPLMEEGDYSVVRDEVARHHMSTGDEWRRYLMRTNEWWNRGDGDARWERMVSLQNALIAERLARTARDPTDIGTDLEDLADLVEGAEFADERLPCLSVRWERVLPVPRDDVPLEAVVAFRRRRRGELLAFRTVLDELKSAIRCASDTQVAQELLIRYAERIERGVHDLQRTLDDAVLPTLLGTAETLIKTSAPALLGGLAVASGWATEVTKLSPSVLSVGILGVASIQIGKYVVDRRDQQRVKEWNSPFAYLYHAKQDRMTE